MIREATYRWLAAVVQLESAPWTPGSRDVQSARSLFNSGLRRVCFGRFLGLGTGWLIAAVLSVSAANPTAQLPVVAHGFVVIAHRGDHTQAHENTLTAVENAIKAGADFVELDVRQSSDGHHVLMHDATVNRTTDGHGRVNELTLDALRTLKVVDRQRPDLASDRVPTLSEALQACRNRIHVYLDFKAGDRARVFSEIQAAGMVRSVIVYCGVSDIPVWREISRDSPLIVSPPRDAVGQPGALSRWLDENPVAVLDGDWRGYDSKAVEAVQRRGVPVWPDVQSAAEDEAYWGRVIAVGFTGAQTDRPGPLVQWLIQQRKR